jgi:hypothetical protein
MKYLLLILCLSVLGCKKEPLNEGIEGVYFLKSYAKYRFVFLDGHLFRDRFNDGGIDESFEFLYFENGDTVTINGYYNLLERKYLVYEIQDTLNFTEVTFNAPYTVDFSLIRY